MRKLVYLLTLVCFSGAIMQGQTAENDTTNQNPYYGDFNKFRFGGYGEMAASYLDYGPNRITPTGSAKEKRGTISIPRFIVAFDYKFAKNWILGAEIEFEYGGTGVAREMEWYSENGEYETEI